MSTHREKATLTLNGEPEFGAPPRPAPACSASTSAAERREVLRLPARPRRRRSMAMLLVVLLVGAAAAVGWWKGRPFWARYAPSWAQSAGRDLAKRIATPDTCEVQRGDLAIVISEGGSLEAVRFEILKSEVEGHATVISLIPEGTLITDDDVKKNKVLVELASDELREKLTMQEITYAAAASAYTDAKEGLAIQKSQCESNVTEGEMNVKFGEMDLELQVGHDLAQDALQGRVDILKLAEQLYQKSCDDRRKVEADLAQGLAEVEKTLQETAKDRDGGNAEGRMPNAEWVEATWRWAFLSDCSFVLGHPALAALVPVPRPPSQPLGREGQGAAAKLLPDAALAAAKPNGTAGVTEPKAAERLGGTALQKKRDLATDIGLAHEEFKRAAEKLVWTARLEHKGYVSHSELETDDLGFKRCVVTLHQALSARDLYLRYQFPKDSEKLLTGYVEAGRELERIRAKSRAAISQCESKLSAAQATLKLNDDKLKKLRRQVDACTIRATHPGLVVYASTGDQWRQMNQPIEIGASVHERQELLKIPDISCLAAEIRVHESVVSRVKPGLTACVHVDAFPTLRLAGKVTKVGVLANSSNRWLNPDLKQYDTQVVLDETPSHLKPGMSAKVEILIATLKAVLLVPVQAVAMREGKTVVYQVNAQGETPRDVTVGESNQELVEIRDGISQGDTILLRAPQVVTVQDEREKRDADKKREEERAKQDADRAKDAKEGAGTSGAGGPTAAEGAGSGSTARPKNPRAAEPADTTPSGGPTRPRKK